MHIVRANCRDHITGRDVDFMVAVLAHGGRESRFLTALLGDTHTRDDILDSRGLLDALQDRPECLSISCYLYFYLLVRHELRHAGLDDRDLADYVAELLAEFSEAGRLRHPLADVDFGSGCLVDLAQETAGRGEDERFALRAHIANYALFVTGLYPERISYREQHRGAPGMAYFESVGSANFKLAGQLPPARKYALAGPFEELADAFHKVRLALNDMAERFLAIDVPPALAGLGLGRA